MAFIDEIEGLLFPQRGERQYLYGIFLKERPVAGESSVKQAATLYLSSWPQGEATVLTFWLNWIGNLAAQEWQVILF